MIDLDTVTLRDYLDAGGTLSLTKVVETNLAYMAEAKAQPAPLTAEAWSRVHVNDGSCCIKTRPHVTKYGVEHRPLHDEPRG